MYEQMIAYVKEMLQQYEESDSTKKLAVRYDRFEHTMRVCRWMQILYEAYPDKEEIDAEALAIACIFHDIGYCEVENIRRHAEIGAEYCRKYLTQIGFDAKKTDFICDLIARHSDKKNMVGIPMELVLLREADLLDDTGVQGLVLDIWMEAACQDEVSFESILQHMERYTLRLMQENPMWTDKAREIWEEKRKLTEVFVGEYRRDLEGPNGWGEKDECGI